MMTRFTGQQGGKNETPQHEQHDGQHTETCSAIWQGAGVTGWHKY